MGKGILICTLALLFFIVGCVGGSKPVDGAYTTENLTCSDNTPYNNCSSTKPRYCVLGNLVDNCSMCGCPSQYHICEEDGTCTPQACSDGTPYGECSETKPKYCDPETGNITNSCRCCPFGYVCDGRGWDTGVCKPHREMGLGGCLWGTDGVPYLNLTVYGADPVPQGTRFDIYTLDEGSLVEDAYVQIESSLGNLSQGTTLIVPIEGGEDLDPERYYFIMSAGLPTMTFQCPY